MQGDDTCVGDNTTHEGNDIIHICKDSDENDFSALKMFIMY